MVISAFGNYKERADEAEPSRLRDGVRAAAPVIVPTLVLGISFGVLAEPVMGDVAPVVMSVVVFAGSAQFAALSVLAAGGGAGPAILSGLLMNARFLPMGFAVGASLPGGPVARGTQGQAIVDAIFPAFYLALLAEEVQSRSAVAAAVLGAVIALALVPVAPPGVPVIAASAAALLGLRR